MKKYVLDASALVIFFQNGKGAGKVNHLLSEALRTNDRPLMSAVNWGEFYTVVLRSRGDIGAQHAQAVMAGLPIEILDVTAGMAIEAAQIKVSHDLSYADSFAAALAIANRATLVTADMDFQKIARRVSILWLPRR